MILIAKIELLDDQMIRAINLYSALYYAEKPTLFLEFGGSKAELEEQIRKVEEIANEYGLIEFLWEKGEENRKKLWCACQFQSWPSALLIPK